MRIGWEPESHNKSNKDLCMKWVLHAALAVNMSHLRNGSLACALADYTSSGDL